MAGDRHARQLSQRAGAEFAFQAGDNVDDGLVAHVEPISDGFIANPTADQLESVELPQRQVAKDAGRLLGGGRRRKSRVEIGMGPAELRPRLAKGRIQSDRLLVCRYRLTEKTWVERGSAACAASPCRNASYAGRSASASQRAGARCRPARHRAPAPLSGDVGLDLEHVGERGVEALLPSRCRRRPGRHPHQLGTHPHPARPARVFSHCTVAVSK